jgi:hypothetical protein
MKDMEEYITNTYGDIKLKRGRWYVLGPGGHIENHELWHRCQKDSWELEMCNYFVYSDFAERPVKPGWRCEVCFAAPPNTIVAVWALLEPERTSEEVQDALEEEERRKKWEAGVVDRSLDDELGMYDGWGSGVISPLMTW